MIRHSDGRSLFREPGMNDVVSRAAAALSKVRLPAPPGRGELLQGIERQRRGRQAQRRVAVLMGGEEVGVFLPGPLMPGLSISSASIWVVSPFQPAEFLLELRSIAVRR